MNATLKATNEKINILSMDSDPRCLVWISFVNNPDRAAFVTREEIQF
jgi:hypothetical protein